MRTGFGVSEGSRFLRLVDVERVRAERERSCSFFSTDRCRSLFASGSFSELRCALSLDFGRSFDVFEAPFETLRLLLRERVLWSRLLRRWSLLDDEDELEEEELELDELERDPELCEDELLSEELKVTNMQRLRNQSETYRRIMLYLALLLETEPLRFVSRPRGRLLSLSFALSDVGDADRTLLALEMFDFILSASVSWAIVCLHFSLINNIFN